MKNKKIKIHITKYIGTGTEPARRSRWDRIRWRFWRLRRQAPYWRCYVFGHDLVSSVSGLLHTQQCTRCHFSATRMP